MKSLATTLLLTVISLSVFSQAVITSFSISPSNPTNCTETTAQIDLQLYCANYTYTGATVNTSGSSITIELNYTVGFICLPAFQYPTVYVNLGQLNAGAVSITAETYLNSSLSNTSSPINTTVISCCGAIAEFTPSEDTICQGDTIFMNNSTVNADSVRWFVEGSFVDTSFSPSIDFDSSGNFEVMLVAYADTCNDTTEHFIQVYGAPALDLGNDTAICTGTELNLSVPGNLNNILWSDGATSSSNAFNAVGTYWVSAETNQGCAGSDTISITAILPETDIDLGEDILICPDDPAVIAAGGTYANYLWSTGDTTSSITVSSVGSFWLEANATGECAGRDTIEVNTYSIVPIDFQEDSVKCGSNTVGTWGTYSGYLWSDGSTASTQTFTDSTMAFLTVTDANDCEQMDSIAVAVWPIPVVDLGADTNFCPGEELILESSIEGSYLWSTGSQSSIIAVLSAGTYWLGVTNDEGCTGYDTIVVDFCVGIEASSAGMIQVFPNPAFNTVRVLSNEKQIEQIRLVDISGGILLIENAMNGSVEIDLSRLSAGTYILEVVLSSNEVVRRRVIKQ